VRYVVVGAIAIWSVTIVQGQRATPTEFEVVSVRPSAPEPPAIGSVGDLRLPPGRWRGLRVTLVQLIGAAYPDYAFAGRVLEGPAWMREMLFDVDAKMDPKTTPVTMAPMMAQLLADRFALRTHTEQRLVDVYLLKMARADRQLGPGLKRSSPPCVEARNAKQPLPVECRGRPGAGLNLSVITVTEFLQYLSFMNIDRPVVDRMGLTGEFDLQLGYQCGPFKGSVGSKIASRSCGPDDVSFFTALQEQAGLKLEPAREMMDVLVIDSVSMPEPD